MSPIKEKKVFENRLSGSVARVDRVNIRTATRAYSGDIDNSSKSEPILENFFFPER